MFSSLVSCTTILRVHTFFVCCFCFFTAVTADRKAVAATTAIWKDTVTSGTYDAPKKTAALYAADATLWGTVSEEVRDTPQQIYAYFVSCWCC